ncbi:hypothetical protein L3X38_032138 [Prunus dulcis]|uniref:PIGA GPI anchor biosynthesis domain-containing protein n=1 Tax=Prunus dulcis TaxID=3755 RepID=A0AAD4VEK4_PRUDU|nr:hypothetical protein L3X38_032138 [Prunus dulcis]
MIQSRSQFADSQNFFRFRSAQIWLASLRLAPPCNASLRLPRAKRATRETADLLGRFPAASLRRGSEGMPLKTLIEIKKWVSGKGIEFSWSLIFFYPNFGGAENHIYYLSQCLLKLGHKVVVMTHAYNNRSGVRYMTGGLKVYYVPWKPFLMQNTFPTFYGTLPRVRTILIREKISLVHGHQAFSTLCHEALMHARTMGYKVVFTDHSLYGFADAGSIHTNKVLQFTLAEVSQAICVSHTSKENTVLRSGFPPEKVFVIPNAVDTAMLKPAPERLSSHEIVIVVISNWFTERVQIFSLNSFQKYAVTPMFVSLLEEMDETCRATLSSTICPNYWPYILKQFFNRSFFIAILEAASCGLLTVSTRVGGVPEVLPDDMIVLAKPDPSDMVQAIKKAISILPKIDPQEMHNHMKELNAQIKIFYNDSHDTSHVELGLESFFAWL